jgi:hypothetical protein
MYIGLHVQYRYSCQMLMKLEFCRHIFEKVYKYQILRSGNRVVPCGPTDRRTETELKKLIFRAKKKDDYTLLFKLRESWNM